jgi:hypothetical protein
VEARRAIVEQAIERRRQHVLPGVLLHVIEPSRPVDIAVHGSAFRDRSAQHMHHPSSSSIVSTTSTPPRRPVSNGWPPDVG